MESMKYFWWVNEPEMFFSGFRLWNKKDNQLNMKILTAISFSLFVLLQYTPVSAQLIKQQQISPPSHIAGRTLLRVSDRNLIPEFNVAVSTRNAGKISASQAVISCNIRIDDTTRPMEQWVCFGTSAGSSIAGPKSAAKGYTTNTFYGLLSGLKSEAPYFFRTYMKQHDYPDKICFGNEFSFITLSEPAKS